jgi:hypothetical protein
MSQNYFPTVHQPTQELGWKLFKFPRVSCTGHKTERRVKEKLAKLDEEVRRLAAIEKTLLASPDKQISLTDPDCRSKATSGGSGIVA